MFTSEAVQKGPKGANRAGPEDQKNQGGIHEGNFGPWWAVGGPPRLISPSLWPGYRYAVLIPQACGTFAIRRPLSERQLGEGSENNPKRP
jgi:hypothetical protein